MIAIITPHFKDFHQFTKYPPFTGEYFEVKWINSFKSVFGRNYDGYIILPYDWRDDLKDMNEILDYLEAHRVKRIKL